MMFDVNIHVVRRLYEAFEQGDDEALLDTLGLDVEWYVPDTLPYGGTFHGVEQVRDYLAALPSFVERGNLDTIRMIDAGNHVVVVGRWSSRTAGGVKFDSRFANIFEVRDGKIVRLDSFLDSARVLRAFQKPTIGLGRFGSRKATSPAARFRRPS